MPTKGAQKSAAAREAAGGPAVLGDGFWQIVVQLAAGVVFVAQAVLHAADLDDGASPLDYLFVAAATGVAISWFVTAGRAVRNRVARRAPGDPGP